MLQLLYDTFSQIQNQRLPKYVVLPFYHAMRKEMNEWTSKSNPSLAKAFVADSKRNTKHINTDMDNKNLTISFLLSPDCFQTILSQLGIPPARYQEAIQALSHKYYHHSTLLNTKEKFPGSPSSPPHSPKKKHFKLNSSQNILRKYFKLPIEKAQAILFANCKKNKISGKLGSYLPITPHEDIVSYLKVSHYLSAHSSLIF
ncbi:hypothetical protein O181_014675 [Austropuccinia psidii MF-1]|uniref:Uncharacterized protein n=1 Tax=Austropuccinia psidii MF-1 TaxID=1389203 RepID=A0A9Q3C2B6_9BASI|nr:hypothetical protein [Austropuccinia psidii MF-1]